MTRRPCRDISRSSLPTRLAQASSLSRNIFLLSVLWKIFYLSGLPRRQRNGSIAFAIFRYKLPGGEVQVTPKKLGFAPLIPAYRTGNSRERRKKRGRCSPRSTVGSPKDLTPRIGSKRGRCWRS
jgi:hypothetical protein